MKLIIFAGGAGTRLWPISRSNTPKQFDQTFNGKSTIQLAVDRVKSLWGIENVYISTNKKFKDIVRKQIPDLPKSNLILEEERRDVGPAVLLALLTLKSQGYVDEVAILWADHLMDRVDSFRSSLKVANELAKENKRKFIYFGERPRFANQNLGWIHFGKEVKEIEGQTVRKFLGWSYHPEIKVCEKMFKSNDWYWNTGYFVTNVDFTLSLYEKYVPEMYKSLNKAFSSKDKAKSISKAYPTLEKVSFDSAIIEKTSPDDAYVLLNDYNWSDPGTLYALKEALQESDDSNVTKGLVYSQDTSDSLIFNYEKDKLVTTIGLSGFVVVNMDDALIVVHKSNIPKIKELVTKLKEDKDLKKFI